MQGQIKNVNIRIQKSYSNIRTEYEYSNIRTFVDILSSKLTGGFEVDLYMEGPGSATIKLRSLSQAPRGRGGNPS